MKADLTEANELLRSAYAIAEREGDDTNWKAFKNSLEQLLLKQSLVLNNTDNLSAATCTPRVYKSVKE